MTSKPKPTPEVQPFGNVSQSSETPVRSKVAVCYCGAPLVYTFAFSGAEYFCLECGAHLGMFDTARKEETPELKKRLARNEAKWEKIRKGLLTGGVMLRDCDICSETNEPHLSHASEAEIAKHNKALKQVEKIGEDDE